MKYTYTKNKRFYKEDTIIELIKFIYDELKIYFDNIDTECWITEKEEPTYIKEEKLEKEGIHIIFPNIIGHTKVLTEFSRDFTNSYSSSFLFNHSI